MVQAEIKVLEHEPMSVADALRGALVVIDALAEAADIDLSDSYITASKVKDGVKSEVLKVSLAEVVEKYRAALNA